MGQFNTREAGERDLAAILGVQHRAFGRVADGLGIPAENLPPLGETVDDLASLLSEGTRFFVAEEVGGRVVGSVRGRLEHGVVEIGRLVVEDGWQRRGVATAVMDLLEESFTDAERFELFTGAEAREPLALYAKRGYVPARSETVRGVELVWLEKPGPAALR